MKNLLLMKIKFYAGYLHFDRPLVFELFRAQLITLIIMSPKRIITLLLHFLANFENFALTPIQLLFGLMFRSFLKIFDALLTRVPAVKDVV